MPIMVFEDSAAKGLAEFIAVKLNLLAPALEALTADLERFIISKAVLRMPLDMTEQGLGMQYVVVRRGETVDAAVKRFGSGLKSDFGFTMKEGPLMEINKQLSAKIAALPK